MSINPISGYSPGTIAGVVAKVSDLERKVRNLEARHTVIGDNTIGSGQVANGAIVTAHIAAGAIDAGTINAQSVAAATGQFININASQIVAGNIDTGRMTANFLAAAQASIGQLSAITANLGNIEAGTVTGATIRTALTGSRVEMDSLGLRGYSSGNVKTFEISSGTGVYVSADPSSIIPGGALSNAALGGGNVMPNSSFEQGLRPTDPTANPLLNAAEGWQQNNAAGTGSGASTEQSYDGNNSYKMVRQTAAAVWVGRRDTAVNRVPVKGGKPYTISAWVYPTTRAEQMRLYFYWFTNNTTDGTANPPYISEYAGVNVNGTPTLNAYKTCPINTWTRLDLTVTAPSNAKFAGNIVYANTTGQAINDVIYVDAIQLEQGDVPTAYSPRVNEILYSSIRSLSIGAGEIKTNNLEAGAIKAQHIGLTWGGNNLLFRSRADDTTTAPTVGWTTTNGSATSTSAAARTGAFGYSVQSNVSNSSSVLLYREWNDTFAVKGAPSTTYTLSAWVQPVGSSASCNLQGRAHNGTALTLHNQTPVTCTADTWTRLTYTFTVAAGAKMDLGVGLAFAGTALNKTVYWTDIQLEQGEYATSYAPAPQEILPGRVGNTQLGPDSVTTEKILAGTILVDDITVVGGLSALSADLGSIEAGIITSATVRSSTSSTRAEMNASGFFYYNAGSTVFSASGGNVTMTGSVTAKQLDFVNVSTTSGSPGQTIRWYRGNYTALIGSTSMWTNGVYGYRMDLTQAQSTASDAIAEHTMIVRSSDADDDMSLVLSQYRHKNNALRLFTKALGNAPMFQVQSSGAITIFPSNSSEPHIWMTRAPYMRITENWGCRFDSGNYQTVTYGGMGTPHVVTQNATTGTGGASYSLGYSYALLHSDYSDEKMKHSIRDVPETAALSKVRALRPVRYGWKGGYGTPSQVQGFVAQEVMEAVPDAVERIINGETKEVTYALNPTALIAALVAAVQELAETVNILRGEAPNARLSRETVKPLKLIR